MDADENEMLFLMGQGEYEVIISQQPDRYRIYANRRIREALNKDWRTYCGLPPVTNEGAGR